MPRHRLPLSLKATIPQRNLVIKGCDEFISNIESESMKIGVYFSFNIAVDEILWNLKPLSEDIKLSITPDKANEHNASLRDMFKPW